MNHSVRTVSCPTCRKAVPWTSGSPFRPFCSARCRQIDLGAWASESYRVPASAPDQGDSDDFFSAPSHDD